MNRGTIAIAAMIGMTGVMAGAFGAHGLTKLVDERALEWWHTGARYQMTHAVLLLAVTLYPADGPLDPRWRRRSVWALIFGTFVFSGTLYAMTLGAPRILGAVTPLGGASLIAGWAMLGIAAIVRPR